MLPFLMVGKPLTWVVKKRNLVSVPLHLVGWLGGKSHQILIMARSRAKKCHD